MTTLEKHQHNNSSAGSKVMDDLVFSPDGDIPDDDPDALEEWASPDPDAFLEVLHTDASWADPLPIEADFLQGSLSDEANVGEQYGHLSTFDPAQAPASLIGDPASDMAHWHQQAATDTCAVAAQEFILDGILPHDFSETDLCQEAIAHGWYTPGGGTPASCVGNLLAAHGLEVERTFGGTFQELAAKLHQGQKVIVGLDADEIWTPGTNYLVDEWLSDYPGMPGQDANHAVQVIGIEYTDPANPTVILNDPGHPDGRGMMIPANEFMQAWADSDYFMVSTTGRAGSALPGASGSPFSSFPGLPEA